MSSLSLHTKIDTLPDNLKQQVSDFIDFLIERAGPQNKKIIPRPGSAKGKIRMSADFDEPLQNDMGTEYTYTADELNMLHERAEKYLKGETKTYTVDESHNMIRQQRLKP